MSVYDEYEPTIGIECHVQLKTRTKLFSGADNDARDRAPNSVVNPIDFGLPGVLPMLNREAVELAIRAGIAMNCEVAALSSFDRKHYFYPDLPKGYQITQLDRPTVGRGRVEVPLPDGTTFTVGITRAHMEEDAGKLTHPEGADYSLVDLNRAGTPLIEIVSEADMHSAEEAKAFAKELYLLMVYADVTHGDLYHGNMRFDVNVSVAKKGSGTLGTRTETKNLNSFRSVERAVEYEMKRQIELLEKGERIKQETRGWHDAKQKTFSQRSKEEAEDYRYFPDADIPPIELAPQDIARVNEKMPTLPPAYRASWKSLGLDHSVVTSLLASPQSAHLVLTVQNEGGGSAAKRVAHWLASAVKTDAEDAELADMTIKVSAAQLIELSDMVAGSELSSTSAKEVFNSMLRSDKSPRQIAEDKHLLQVSDQSAIEAIVDEVLADPASQKAVEDIRTGNDKAIGFLVGQVMKKSKGQANPAMASDMIRKKL
jgi:aspartyl-tRNA(Asn)/glutamyl-tRNA(Gln) amidotransferase subunit B